MDQRDGAVRRFSAGVDHCARATRVGERSLRRFTQALDGKPRGNEVRAGLGQSRKKARRGGPRPRRRVVRLAARPLHDLGQTEPGAGLQNAVDLVIERTLVGDVHGDVHRVDAVEHCGAERHRQRIALIDGNTLLEREQGRQVPGDVAEFGRHIDSADPAAEAPGEVACRSADAAADIENVVRLGDQEPVRHVLGRLQAAAVEVVVGGQRLEGRAPRIDSVLAQPRLEPREQIAARVMAGNVGRRGHWEIRARLLATAAECDFFARRWARQTGAGAPGRARQPDARLESQGF